MILLNKKEKIMKDISQIEKSKEVIVDSKINREFIYYLVLFTIALISAVVLIFIAFKNNNLGLKIYSLILTPLFLILSLLSARLLYASHNMIFVKNSCLYIKRSLYTKKILISKIDGIKVASNEKESTVFVKISYGDKTYRLSLKGLEKEDVINIKKILTR